MGSSPTHPHQPSHEGQHLIKCQPCINLGVGAHLSPQHLRWRLKNLKFKVILGAVSSLGYMRKEEAESLMTEMKALCFSEK